MNAGSKYFIATIASAIGRKRKIQLEPNRFYKLFSAENNTHLMSALEGNSQFGFHQSLTVSSMGKQKKNNKQNENKYIKREKK